MRINTIYIEISQFGANDMVTIYHFYCLVSFFMTLCPFDLFAYYDRNAVLLNLNY